MAVIDYPGALLPSVWDKHKSALAKVKNVPPQQIGEGLVALQKKHNAIDWSLFSADKLDTTAQVEARQKSLEDEIKAKVSKLDAEADSMADHGDYFAKEGKKFKEVPKEPIAAAAVIGKAASQYLAEIKDVCSKARAALDAKLTKLKATEKKPAAAAAGNKPKVESKAAKLVRTKALESIRAVKKPKPGAKPIRFLVVQGKVSVRVYMGPSAGPTQEKMLKAMIPTEKPYKVFKDPNSQLMWEKNAVTFVSDRLPLGLAKKIQLALRVQTKLNLKVRVRKTTGEVEEGEDAPDIPDDQLQADPAEAKAAAAAGKDFAKRLGELKPAIDKAMKGPAADDVKKMIKSITDHGKAQRFEDAGSELDEFEAFLEEGGDEEGGGEAPAAPGQPGTAPSPQLATAKSQWVGTRDKAVSEITRLSKAIVDAYKGEGAEMPNVIKAIKQLKERADRLKGGLDRELDAALSEKDPGRRAQLAKKAKESVASMMKLVSEDDVLRELDNNEILNDINVVGPMKERLKAIEAALA